MAVKGCHNSHLGNPGRPVVNCLSKKMCSHVFWHSVVICHNSTLTFLFVTVIFLMSVLDIPCKMQMLIFFFLVKIWAQKSHLGPNCSFLVVIGIG